MWLFALQADLARTWFSALEAATKTCTDATRSYTDAWTAATSPPAPRGLQFTFPFAHPGLGFWGTNPFVPFGAMMPWMTPPWMAAWQHQWSAASFWQMPYAMTPFPWAANWPTTPIMPAAVADLMTASYRTATGHAAAAIMMAPFQPKPAAPTWFGWPYDTGRRYLN